MGVPKTIDNDLVMTDHTPGYGSTAKYVASTLREIILDATCYAHPSVTIVELMGRHAGWVTAASVLARTEYSRNPYLIYMPEHAFDMEEFKGMLSMPTRDEINRSKGKSRDSSAQKFSRDKPLTEKYKVFSDFEKNVLAMVKSEINEMTDLWFDYEPVRRRGVRKYEFLYIFIKYKNREEMKSVRAFHQEHKGADTEVSRKPRKRRSSVSKEALEQYNQPLKEAILTTTYRLARNELAVKAQYQTYEKKLTPEERNIFIDIFTYTSKILTNTKKRDQAEETLEALNRIIKDNNGLKTWALGMSVKYKAMLERAKERKSAQYYRTVVYNDIIENSAAIIADGTKRAALLDGDRTDLFKFDWSQFDE